MDEQGYLIFKNVLSSMEIETILARLEELWAAEGDLVGEENYIEPGVRRLANLANQVEIFRSLYACSQGLEVVEDQPGDALVFNGHCWHAGGPDETDGHCRQNLDQNQAAAPSRRELLGLDDE
jgi:hypothetical protein